MDPGGSELDSSLSQLDNPCLIVEDSQPDSAAAEDDPDSSYRSLLARRLSNLQPTSPSPVLELISSPAGRRCSQTDGAADVGQSDTHHSPAPLDLNTHSEAREHSQVLEVCSPSNQKSRKCVGGDTEMDAGADSTTQSAQSEGGVSQFGFLELSETQGFGNELDGSQESQEEVDRTPAGQTDSQRLARQGVAQNTTGLGSGSQNSASKRSEVSSSSSSEPLSSGRKEMTIQDLLHTQDSEASAGGTLEDVDDDEVPSSQDDMFDMDKTGTRVDSTVSEPGSQRLPTCTPANSLHLLHLSGQGTLVQESLSQSSVEFVAPTQDNLSQTPLIVPNSPTAQEDDQAAEEPMDTSLPPDEPDHARKKEEEPMEMDQPPVQSGVAPKLQPSASTPVSQNSPGFVLEKSLPVPTLPEFSHDIFVPTQSQETGSSCGKTETLRTQASHRENPVTAETGSPKRARSGEKHKAPIPSQAQHSVVAESFRLELSSHSEHSNIAHLSREVEVEEDSQATQIEGLEGPADTAASESVLARHSQQKEGNSVEPETEPENAASSPKVSQVPDLAKDTSLRDGIEEVNSTKEKLSQKALSEPPKLTTQAANVTKLADTIDLTRTGGSQTQDSLPSEPAASSQRKLETVDLTASSGSQDSLPASARKASGPSVVFSLSESQSVLPNTTDGGAEAQDVAMEVQSKSPEVIADTGTAAVGSSQTASQKQGHTAGSSVGELEVADEGMDEAEDREETTGAEGSALCLSLSQSQVLSPEPMEEGGSPSFEEQDGSKDLVVEESERISQQKGRVVTSQLERGVASGSVGGSQPLQKEGTPADITKEKVVSSQNGTGSQAQGLSPVPEKHSQSDKASLQSAKPSDTRHPRAAAGHSAENSGSKSPGDSSGEIPFHFTLPKEGELIRPVPNATPPLISQLKQTPRHSTPIEMSSFSERSAGDVTREAEMAASDIAVEESGEEAKGDSTISATTEHDGKLSLRMKLVTPVEEGSSGSERFSLQKPALSEEGGSVSKVTTVVKAVTSPRPSPSVFSRVCEVRRQAEAEEKGLPSMPCTPTRGDLFGSPLSLESDSERDLLRSQSQRPKNAPGNSQSELSPSPQGEGGAPAGMTGSSTQERVQRHDVQEKELHAETQGTSRAEGVAAHVGREGETNGTGAKGLPAPRTPPRQRAVSQQTSFDTTTIPSPPSKLRQRAVSQQTSFEAAGPQYPTSRGEPETPPPRPPVGQNVRRHVRTIKEVRTTVTRIITDVYYENGLEVDRKVTEETEEPLVDCQVVENDISPSRTGSSMTSGDLADVSSLSSKASSLQHSSSGASSSGPGPARRPDFIVPSSRGAKSASPRKGRGGSNGMEERYGARGTRALTPLSPRGRARRGRPRSRGPLSRGAGTPSRDAVRGPPLSSSEDEPYTRVCPRLAETPPKRRAPGRSAPLDSSPDSSGGASSFVGLRVVAKWSSNSYFYSGCITRDLGEGRYRLLFDDSHECDVQGKDILLCDPIPLETEVTALSEDEYFSTGVVKGHRTEGSEFFYSVEKDGQCKWYGRMAVILSMEQGNRLREHYGLGPYEPVTPLAKASDISLDNLVEGKRKRRGNMGATGTPSRSSSDSPRTPGPSGKRKLISSADDEKTPAKRGRKSAGPRAGQRPNVCNTSGSGTDLPSDPNDLVETHGPLPQTASLFLGYAFLLTASSESDRESNQQTGEGEEEQEEYVQTAPYNKRYTERQLEAGGGYVLQDFNEGQCKAAYQSLLIADQHCRTRKYLLCVASGIPCVSHMWVRDCCHDNQLLNYRNYLLPAGMGPEDAIVEWHPRRSPFNALKVLLVFEEPTEFLADLLKMGGAVSVCHHKADSDSPGFSADALDLVVAGRSCPPSVLKHASSLDLPVVSAEWLIQSVICGERLGYSSHAQFRHDYSP
ncbi:TP53-binding protein 1 [Megalops cyprinoides]|uniref:TP53-binding protein 1 n=1 Tax=Megalops cyprinoides TaxID=118141 RepID=UPI0018643982|nr:TP53-binding protein 1 [Megalops cyprinoides]